MNKEIFYNNIEGMKFQNSKDFFEYLYNNNIYIDNCRLVRRNIDEKINEEYKAVSALLDLELVDGDKNEEYFINNEGVIKQSIDWLFYAINEFINIKGKKNKHEDMNYILVNKTDISSKTILISISVYFEINFVKDKKFRLSENLVKYYNNIIGDIWDTLENYGINPDITLYHKDMVNTLDDTKVENEQQLKSIFIDKAKNGLYNYDKSKRNLMLKVINEY